jgi:hypothetical protein
MAASARSRFGTCCAVLAAAVWATSAQCAAPNAWRGPAGSWGRVLRPHAVARVGGVSGGVLLRLSGGEGEGDTDEGNLRFEVGERILARTPDGWRPGTIVQLRYREPDWPEEHNAAPYQIELDSGARLGALSCMLRDAQTCDCSARAHSNLELRQCSRKRGFQPSPSLPRSLSVPSR